MKRPSLRLLHFVQNSGWDDDVRITPCSSSYAQDDPHRARIWFRGTKLDSWPLVRDFRPLIEEQKKLSEERRSQETHEYEETQTREMQERVQKFLACFVET